MLRIARIGARWRGRGLLLLVCNLIPGVRQHGSRVVGGALPSTTVIRPWC